MLDDLMFHEVTLIKQDGSKVYEDIKANVQPEKIFIDDGSLPLEEGDVITHKLKNGITEKYLILDTGFYGGIPELQDHYQARVKKLSAIQTQKELSPPVQQIINNVSGNNPRVNMNSIDNSVNTVNQQNNKVFQEVIDIIKSIDVDEASREILHQDVIEMERAAGTIDYKGKYDKFMGHLANNLTVFGALAPHLSKLTEFI